MMIKKILFFSFLTCWLNLAQSQAALNNTNATAHASAMLDIDVADKGILIPRLSTAEISGISAPANGLLVFNKTQKTLWLYDNNKWFSVAGKGVSKPIGSIIDWYRPDSSIPLPVGYKICDGTTINDVNSPYVGTMIPNFHQQFIYGTTDANAIGQTGGANTHSHQVSIPFITTNSAGTHNHNFNFVLRLTTEDTHNHYWSSFLLVASGGAWFTRNSGDSNNTIIANWNGMSGNGDGHFPIQVQNHNGATSNYTDEHTHLHALYLGNQTSTSRGGHTHTANFGNAPVIAGSNIPPHIKVLKLMRIK